MDIENSLEAVGTHLNNEETAQEIPIESINTVSDSEFEQILEVNGFNIIPNEEALVDNSAYTRTEAANANINNTDTSLLEDIQRAIEALEDSARNVFEQVNSDPVEATSDEPIVEDSEVEEEEDSSDSEFIPENSATFNIDETTSRFSGMEWYEEVKRKSIILAGLGGIGSWTALLLARLKPGNIVMYDRDTVEAANLSGQMFGYRDVGKPKASVVSSNITNFCSISHYYAINRYFDENCPSGDIMICGFDNMEARKLFFNSWKSYVYTIDEDRRKDCLFIDGRLNASMLQVFCMRGDDEYDIKRYEEEFLFSDSEAEETVCSMKQTTYLACMIGSIITNLFVNFVANSLNPIIPYGMPFFTSYDAQNTIFYTEN